MPRSTLPLPRRPAPPRALSRIRRLGACVALLLPLLACGDSATTVELAPEGPRFAIGDATRGFKQGFYWLPPMVRQPDFHGTFDPDLSPEVEVCRLENGACAGEPLLTFTMDPGGGSRAVRLGDDHYIVNWHTDETEGDRFRILVRAGPGALIGYADVQLVSKGKELRNVDTGEYIALVDGRTLPIRFRVETGVIGVVTIEPAEGTILAGESLALAASVTDLHGHETGAHVLWSSSDTTVALVDDSGVVTGRARGTATITASRDHERASAVVTVRTPVARVAVEPTEASLEPGGTVQLQALPLDGNGVPVTDREVAWASSDPGVATVNATGLVSAVADGTAVITATAEGVVGTATVIVASAPPESWHALGDGLEGVVYALASHEGALFAGGNRGASRWDGASWHLLPSPGFPNVVAFQVHEGTLFAAGGFEDGPGRVVRWDGGAWEPVGGSMDGPVYALAVHEGSLIAGGEFEAAGGTPARHVARWNGAAWEAIGGSAPRKVVALAVHEGELVAGSADAGVRAWDGTSWRSLGAPFPLLTFGDLLVHRGELLAGGPQGVLRWDGASWQAIPDGPFGGTVAAMAARDDDLFVGGFFPFFSDLRPANHVARWDGTSWHDLDGGVQDASATPVYALAIHEGSVIAGGSFGAAAAVPARAVARWGTP